MAQILRGPALATDRADQAPQSHSPHNVMERTTPPMRAMPFTPIHSPHHSVASSASARTPVHVLSIHEYRKLQNNPCLDPSPAASVRNKTLRRKAAAPTLNGIERTPSIRRVTPPDFRPSPRPLQESQSAQQLVSPKSPFHSQAFLDQYFRPQTVGPQTLIDSASSFSSLPKVRHFNSRKRLPRPSVTSGPGRFQPTTSYREVNPETSNSSDTKTTTTASSFSLSRFPRPPRLSDLSPSPPHDDGEDTHLNAPNFATSAPVTPPATPATIHYRGASFDLVNPHASLLLHDIVTPSKDFGSSEYLAVPSFEEPLIVSSEMAPKRALYGDLNSAHAGIMRRAEDSFTFSDLDLPLPPTPAAISPGSSAYTSPIYSPESNFAPSPLAVNKAPNESRFSLKQLTRSLTNRLARDVHKEHVQELQELGEHRRRAAQAAVNETLSRELEEPYIMPPEASHQPLSPASPATPTSPYPQSAPHLRNEESDDAYITEQQSPDHLYTESLTSMVPDDSSIENGRCETEDMDRLGSDLHSRPYYDDLESIYPSSSIYTADGRRRSNYQQSLASNRQSNRFARYSGFNTADSAYDYDQERPYNHATRMSQSAHFPREQYLRSFPPSDGMTDTISRIIDQYEPQRISRGVDSMQGQKSTNNTVSVSLDYESITHAPGRSASSPADFGMQPQYLPNHETHAVGHKNEATTKRLAMARDLGSPPRHLAPLAPPFEYDEVPWNVPRTDPFDMFSNSSSYSYGDTRNLLQVPQTSGLIPPVPDEPLQPSSSYSQPLEKPLEASSSSSQGVHTPSPTTPQVALDQAEKIFEHMSTKEKAPAASIPAMWGKRNSGSQFFRKKRNENPDEQLDISDTRASGDYKGADENDGDWESMADDSQRERKSLDSLADYSSSEGTRNSLGLNSNGSFPSWAEQAHSQGPSIYSHPSPIRTHENPFSSSPPLLRPSANPSHSLKRTNTSLDSRSSPTAPLSTPVFRGENIVGSGVIDEPHAFTPWTDPYAFSDKETQELLASGPNDKIMFDKEGGALGADHDRELENRHVRLSFESPRNVFDDDVHLERENTFEKLCVVGPKGNLTGTPQGTGMYETGSSVADTSSPGNTLSSSLGRRKRAYPGFYATPFAATGSVTRVERLQTPVHKEDDRTPSEVTLFPKGVGSDQTQEVISRPGEDRRPSVRCSTTFDRAQRRVSRTAVPGQTKLRQMILSPEAARKTLSSQDTSFSRFAGASERPSTSDTNTPLHRQPSPDTSPRTILAHQYSPHLLCPERAPNPEEEERRRKLSWTILAIFCLLPPCILLYRIWGDSIIASVTKGHLSHCTPKSKKAAFIAGIVVNIGVAITIVIPVVIVHALGAA